MNNRSHGNQNIELNIYYSDTFTSHPFSGNPTAVLICRNELGPELSTLIAKEMNLPVTAFIIDQPDQNCFPLRYFTITGEIPACGHATLAAADVISSRYGLTESAFCTSRDIHIKVRMNDSMIWMDYPVLTTAGYAPSVSMLKSLGINSFRWSGFCSELETVFIELNDPEQLRSVRPDFNSLLSSAPEIKELVITSVSDNQQYDFFLRSFCPWIGIDEDPVTGSVHSVLGPHWMAHTNKNKLRVFQASERGGEVYLDVKKEKVSLGGYVCRIFEGKMKIPRIL